jgi:hypothetical protein
LASTYGCRKVGVGRSCYGREATRDSHFLFNTTERTTPPSCSLLPAKGAKRFTAVVRAQEKRSCR